MDGKEDGKTSKAGDAGLSAAELGAFKAVVSMAHGSAAPFQVSISGFGLPPAPSATEQAEARCGVGVGVEAGRFVDLPEFHSIECSGRVEISWAPGAPGFQFGPSDARKYSGRMEVVDGALTISGHEGSVVEMELRSPRLDSMLLAGSAKARARLAGEGDFDAMLKFGAGDGA